MKERAVYKKRIKTPDSADDKRRRL